MDQLPYQLRLETGGDALFVYAGHVIKPPVFEVDGKVVVAGVYTWSEPVYKNVSDEVLEMTVSGRVGGGLELTVRFRLTPKNRVLRFQYQLKGEGKRLTKETSNGEDHLSYLKAKLDVSDSKTTEVRLSEYLEPAHTYTADERTIGQLDFSNERCFMGPILTNVTENGSFLLAYEHGSQVPDAFVKFHLQSNGEVSLNAKKGNYYSEYDLSKGFTSIWLEVLSVKGGDENALAAEYREFVLKYMSTSYSRKPYIFYNTWNAQERDRFWRNKDYHNGMNEEFIMKDIDVAHSMGIEVYVMDVGWFHKSGDWKIHPKYFPNGIKPIKDKLDSYGMKLGMWFEPKSAALSSILLQGSEDCIMSWHGKQYQPDVIWDSEESHQLCLISEYADKFADKLIERAHAYGITYFKWDAISQYGCDSPNHNHGTEFNSRKERADNYAFNLGLAMVHIVQKVIDAIPEAIVDFDVTEGSRFVGLSFLSVGKFFLINNGASAVNFDMPFPPRYHIEDPGYKPNTNIMFYPGPARTWTCRTPLTYDKWVPSILFLVHYYPDDTVPKQLQKDENLARYSNGAEDECFEVNVGADNQKINVGSLILGHNGIWGDLQSVSDIGIKRIRKYLDQYKRLRDEITLATLLCDGKVGGNPETYEKINPATGKGVVVIFSSSFGLPFSARLTGRYTYLTKHKVDKTIWHDCEGLDVTHTPEAHALISVTFHNASARMVFFG